MRDLLTRRERALLTVLRSDLKDCRDPKVLEKYPHLGNPDVVAGIETKIAELEARATRLRIVK